MAEADEVQPNGEHKPRTFQEKTYYVNVTNTVILAVTMLAVIVYAFQACNQTAQMIKSVNQEVMVNRPVVIANGVAILEKNSAGVPIKVQVKTANFGRSTAPFVVTAGHIFAVDAGQPAPIDPECDEKAPWPKRNKPTALAPFVPPQYVTVPIQADPTNKGTAGTAIVPVPVVGSAMWAWDRASGQDLGNVSGKTVFVSGCIYYTGLDGGRYFFDVCVSWAGGGDFPTCTDTTRNQVH